MKDIIFKTTLVLSVLAGALASGGCEIVAWVDRSELEARSDAGALAEAGAPSTDAGAAACASPADCPAPSGECTAATCEQGRCGTKTKSGEVCSSGVCDGHARCVAPSCADRLKNNAETDIDCGGRLCPPCADYMQCQESADCASKICDSLSFTCGG